MMRVVVVGQGYVGLPLSVRAAQVGHQVIAYDVDRPGRNGLLAGESYIEDARGARHPVDGLVRRGEVNPEELASADAVVLLSDHDQFDFDEIVQQARFIFDCRYRLRGPHVQYL